ncbi:MAG: tetratricopeptide repeat protein [Planctomycetaceae bacterium]|jgi:tetratricopeptide (TPR) repeat protein|nr:tetratricopeptide repeat protein [Planctomycetaceae bacterium]MBT6153661.1 tetratricopeptide repeat protein [Planctomycetaceae bacterium]MBT6484288.1 tetratricopeptide repeat protein [Planctomycetaceae bacterium]MBT6496682.1 tetratricopeptide repeat protein [Planctomycetaceae bacterium]
MRRTLLSSVLLTLCAFILQAAFDSPAAEAQLTAQRLLSNAVSDYGPQYKDIDRAIALFRQGKLEECRKALSDGKTKNPQLAPVNVMLSHLLFASGNARGGVSLLEGVVTKEPNDPEAYIMLADLALRQRRLGEAELMFGKGLAICAEYSQNPIRKKNLRNSGLAGVAAVAEARGDWKQAITRIVEWSKVDPKNANAHSRMGLAQFRLKQYDESKASFATARKLNGKLPLPEISLALLHEQTGNRDQAEKLFGEAVKAAPSDLNTRLAVVQWALVAGKNELAAKNITAAQKLDANSLQVKVATGLAARFAGEHKQAMTAFEGVLKQSPRNFTAMNHLALTLIDSTEEKERIRALGYAHLNAQINSNRKARTGREATVTLAWILFRVGHADAAERILKGILNAGSIGSESAYYAALILADRGQREAAQKILASALRSKSQFPGRDEAERILQQLARVEQAQTPAKKQK